VLLQQERLHLVPAEIQQLYLIQVLLIILQQRLIQLLRLIQQQHIIQAEVLQRHLILQEIQLKAETQQLQKVH
tara:strand:+ start:793 stop:1011 length:219 start_codon:yes stop_codon:yes gene_type:complete